MTHTPMTNDEMAFLAVVALLLLMFALLLSTDDSDF